MAPASTIRSPSWVPVPPGRTFEAAAPRTPEAGCGLTPAAAPAVFPTASLPELPPTALAVAALVDASEEAPLAGPKIAARPFVTPAREHGARPPLPITSVARRTVLPCARPRIRYVPSGSRRPLIVRRTRSVFVPS